VKENTTMAQQGKSTSPAAPPFATSQGKPANQGSGATGAHNFLTDPKGSGPATGARDFTKESRPQSEAKEEVTPNSQEIPTGGKTLKADPTPGGFSSGTGGVQGVTKKPFKV
jgi:hypothetical protein